MLGTTLPSGGPFHEPPGGPFRDERASSPEEIIQIIRRAGTKLALRLYASAGNTPPKMRPLAFRRRARVRRGERTFRVRVNSVFK